MLKKKLVPGALVLGMACLFLCMGTLFVSCDQMQTCTTNPVAVEETKPTGTIKLGYLICNSTEETVERFAPVAAYIGHKLGLKVQMIPMHTYEVQEDLEKKEIKFFKINSIVYMQLKHNLDINLMAGEKRGPLGRSTTGTIIVRKGSGIKTIKDLKGKKFAFGPMFAPFGYLVQYDMMLRNGLDPEEDLKYYAIPWGAYKHEKAIYNVQMGAFDAASGPMLDLILMSEQGKVKWGDKYPLEDHDFEVIAESEPAPYCTFASTKDADPEMSKKIQKILFGLSENDVVKMSPEWLEVEGVEWDKGGFLRSGEVLNVCKAGVITGYAEAKDSDYDGLREMAKRVGMDPYSKF